MTITGVVGTAKNTGKTTTLSALLEEAARRGARFAVTGIGYDGEEIDTVTGLPKPRLLLHAGTIAATSEACLGTSTAAFRVIKETNAVTALGRVVIIEVTHPGLLVLAGPNTKRLLHDLTDEVGGLGIDRLFVDGSLNRIAAMSVVDAVVFTTGASRSTEIMFLSEEARAICRLFALPGVQAEGPAPETVALYDASDRHIAQLPGGSLYDKEDAASLLRLLTPETRSIVVPKMVSLAALEYLLARIADERLQPLTLAFSDPTTLLLAGEPIATVRALERAQACAVSVAYRRPIRFAAMTVNPFYPLKREEHHFESAYIDKQKLLDAVTHAVTAPVFNIKEDGSASSLFALL